MADGYVSNWGNDDNDGLSWETAKRTFQGAKDANLTSLYAKGFFYEQLTFSVATVINGDNLILSGLNLAGIINPSGANISTYRNIIFKNAINLKDFAGFGENIILEGCSIFNIKRMHLETGTYKYFSLKECLISNVPEAILDFNKNGHLFKNNTLYKVIGNILIYDNGIPTDYNNNLIVDSSIEFLNNPEILSYTLLTNSDFKFTGGSLGFDETTFEYPIGVDDLAKIQNLRNRMVIVYGGLASDYLVGCKYYSGSYNDIFVDADNGDFNLVPFCIAAHMSYDGDYIGARPEGTKAEWNTDFASIVNIDANGNVIDQTIDASAETSIIDIGHERDVLNFQALGQRAARNGQQVNIETNLGSNISAGSSVLTDGSVYECVDDTIVRDDSGSTGQNPWETFTAVDEGAGVGLGFTGSGEVKEVYTDDRYEEKVQLKSSKTDGALAAAVLITSKLHSDPVLVNVDGNGEPTHGDADVGYVEGTAIPLRSRYIQFFIKIKANNLPAR